MIAQRDRRVSGVGASGATTATTAASASRWDCARTTRSWRGCGGPRRSRPRRAPPFRRPERRDSWRRSPPTRCAARRCGAGGARACGAPRLRRGRCRGCRGAARARRARRSPGPAGPPAAAAAASMRASRSVVAATTVAPVPSSVRGNSAKARRRSANCGSAASNRARVRSPPAATAACAAWSGSVPSATNRAVECRGGDRAELDPNTPRRDRHQVDGHEVGEDDEVGRRRRLLDRLQQAPGTDGVEQVELVEDQHLAVALDRRQGGLADDLGGLLGGDRRPDAHDLADVGMLAGQRQPRVATCRTLRYRSATGRRTPGPPRPSSSRAARRTGRRAPATRRPPERVDGTVLADNVGPDRIGVRHGRHDR